MHSLQTSVFGSGSPLAVLHGFTQSGATWAPFAGLLGDRRLIAPSAPGHGRSAGVAADLWGSADLLAGAITAALGSDESQTDLLGYSMGGRMALHLALRSPQLVRRLVLLSATAGIDDPSERKARRASDEQIARRAESGTLAEFVEWWLERPIFSTLPAGAASAESRMGGSVEGLAASLRLAGTGSQEPLWPRLGELDMPVLVMAGVLDRPYVERAERMVSEIGDNAQLVLLPEAGHAAHLETPAAFADAVNAFLD